MVVAVVEKIGHNWMRLNRDRQSACRVGGLRRAGPMSNGKLPSGAAPSPQGLIDWPSRGCSKLCNGCEPARLSYLDTGPLGGERPLVCTDSDIGDDAAAALHRTLG